jgi:hypothetical protein
MPLPHTPLCSHTMTKLRGRVADESYEQHSDFAMLPPKKRYRNGTSDLEDAVRDGILELSLPEFPKRECSTDIASDPLGKSGEAHSNTFNVDEAEDKKTFHEAESDELEQTGERDDTTRHAFDAAPLLMLQPPNKHYEHSNNDGPQNGGSPLLVPSIVSQDGSTTSATIDDNPESGSAVVLDGVSHMYRQPDPGLPRFSDIIGHGAVKLRIEEVLLPIVLPLANSILVGG